MRLREPWWLRGASGFAFHKIDDAQDSTSAHPSLKTQGPKGEVDRAPDPQSVIVGSAPSFPASPQDRARQSPGSQRHSSDSSCSNMPPLQEKSSPAVSHNAQHSGI